MYPPASVGRSSARPRATAILVALAFWAANAWAQPASWQGLTLQDHRQAAVHARALQGQAVLMHFVFTTCSTVCPVQVRELAEVHAALPDDVRRRVRFVSVSVDPLQDTPASLAAFARRMGADRAGWHFVTGAPAQVHTLLDRLQVMDTRATGSRARPEDHRTSLYLYDAAGTLVQRYGGVPVDRPRLTEEITQVVRRPAAAHLVAGRR